MSIQETLWDILACPTCKTTLVRPPNEDILICDPCRVRFPIRVEIPILLMEEATPLKSQDAVASNRFPPVCPQWPPIPTKG